MALRPGLDDIREELRLASTRQTTRVEDSVYSLLGIYSFLAFTFPRIYFGPRTLVVTHRSREYCFVLVVSYPVISSILPRGPLTVVDIVKNYAIRNALVEIHFTIHHTHLGKQTPPHDTFRANIEQILTL